MNILKKILYGILIFFMLLSGFILLCALKPELSEKIADVLKLEEWSERDNDEDVEDGAPEDREDTEEEVQITDVIPVSLQEEPEQPENSTPPNASEHSDKRQEDDTQSEDPAISGISVPENVAGRNGYQPIQDDSREVDDEEAERLKTQIGVGETGDGLSFDAGFYPYYAMLDAQGQHIYRQIYANAMALNQSFAPIEDVSTGRLKNVFAAVYNDHPELFWMDTAYSCKFQSSGRCVEIDLQFNSTSKNLEQEKSTFEAKSKAITEKAQELGSNYEKEKYVHDALISQVDYAASAGMNQSAYSALVNGRTVCAGYARAFQYMMQQLGIPCYYCTGYAGESHAWNIIALDDGFYNVDATWDDTGEGTYDYFNKSDADYAGTHLRQDLAVNLPPCNGTAYRNLEPVSGTENDDGADGNSDSITDGRRKLSDFGIAPENALTTLEDYYNDCYRKLLQNGRGSYSFTNAIYGDAVFLDVYGSYQTDDYRQGYMDSAISQTGSSTCLIIWSIEELQDGYYLVSHDVSME